MQKGESPECETPLDQVTTVASGCQWCPKGYERFSKKVALTWIKCELRTCLSYWPIMEDFRTEKCVDETLVGRSHIDFYTKVQLRIEPH